MAALLCGCGYIGPVLPPALEIPQRATDLRAAEYGDRIIAEFTLPAMTTEGLPLKEVRSVEVVAGVAPNPFSMAAWAASAKKYSLTATAPGAYSREIPVADWTGKSVTMAVRATGPKGKTSDWSNLVTLPVEAPLAKPAAFKLDNLAKGIELKWTGAAGEHYHVYRGTGEEAPSLLGSTETPEYVDSTIEYGKTYRYYVEGFKGELQRSDMAQSAPITPEDVFAPGAPAGLTAEMGTSTIELSWERNTEPRFQGYNVYRSVDGGPFQKVAGPIVAPAYSDHDVQAGKKYRYQIASVGTNGRESERSGVVEVAAQ